MFANLRKLTVPGTPGTPLDLRQQMMTRFAEEICPRYSRAMRQKRAA